MDAAGRARREALRVLAIELLGDELSVEEVARRLRVSVRSVYRWRSAFDRGGTAALASKGPLGQRCRLSAKSQAKLAVFLDQGPAAHGWDEDQCWTGARVATLIGRKFHVSYTPGAAARLMRRLGFTPQQPVRRAVQRDQDAIEAWKETTWPEVKDRRPRSGPGSASKTKPART